MNHIILLNGPPRSGKDTIGAHFELSSKYRSRVEKFAAPIKAALKATFNLSDKEFQFFDNEWKDKPHPRLLGYDWRFWCIQFSEKWLKVYCGSKVFGMLLSSRLSNVDINETYDFILVTDSGFDDEARVLIQDYPGRVHLIQIYRDGCDYSKDSRNYLNEETKALIGEDNCFRIDNNTTLEDLFYDADNILDEIYNR